MLCYMFLEGKLSYSLVPLSVSLTCILLVVLDPSSEYRPPATAPLARHNVEQIL